MTDRPAASVIVPTRNRPGRLAACLNSLERQDYPRGLWRLVVVNDGGADPSPAFPPGLPVTLLHAAPRGPAAARNRGAAAAETDLLVFLDDDCRAGPSWLSEIIRGIVSSPYQACMGRTLNGRPDRWPARAYQYFMEFHRDYARMPNDDLYLVMSNNAVYRRDAFWTAGGFNEDFPRPGAEDLELSHRLAAGGGRQGYLPQAVLHHAHNATAAGYVRQQFQYGRGFARMAGHLHRDGIPLLIGQRRRPQFHLHLLGTMLRHPPGIRESLLVWAGILAHAAGARWEGLRPGFARSDPAGGAS
jgi:GT2 family glycosyltransferase